ncbi:hypothetical protein [Bradyrhizobium sp.]|uniref:hypothetical protein n=1 Tax=Bradyrhizobium sp. TaxID=376 RepID=UPI00403774A8
MTMAEGLAIGLGFLAIVAPDFWPKMPRPLSYTLAGIGLAWLTYSLILGIESSTHMKLQNGPLATIILGAVLIALGMFWHISRLGTGEPSHSGHSDAAEQAPPSVEPSNHTKSQPFRSARHRELLSDALDQIEIILDSRGKEASSLSDQLFYAIYDIAKRYGMQMATPEQDAHLANSLARLTEQLRKSLFEEVLRKDDPLPVREEIAAVLGSDEYVSDLHHAAIAAANILKSLANAPHCAELQTILGAQNRTIKASKARYEEWTKQCLERSRTKRDQLK